MTVSPNIKNRRAQLLLLSTRVACGRSSLLLKPARKAEIKYKTPLYEGIRELLRQPGLKQAKISERGELAGKVA